MQFDIKSAETPKQLLKSPSTNFEFSNNQSNRALYDMDRY